MCCILRRFNLLVDFQFKFKPTIDEKSNAKNSRKKFEKKERTADLIHAHNDDVIDKSSFCSIRSDSFVFVCVAVVARKVQSFDSHDR